MDGYSSQSVVMALRNEFLKYKAADDFLAWMSYVDLKLRLPELLLMRVDKMCMAVSLEARVPFLDKKIVSLSMSIPENIKTKNGELKYILKRASSKILPEEIINRKKQGFGAPVKDFRSQGLGQMADTVINEFLNDTDYFHKKKVTELALTPKSASYWYIFNLACWHKDYIKQEQICVN